MPCLHCCWRIWRICRAKRIAQKKTAGVSNTRCVVLGSQKRRFQSCKECLRFRGGETTGAIDPKPHSHETGCPGYRLKANEAPIAAPVAFGPGQLFVPRMDGTVLLLPVARLR